MKDIEISDVMISGRAVFALVNQARMMPKGQSTFLLNGLLGLAFTKEELALSTGPQSLNQERISAIEG